MADVERSALGLSIGATNLAAVTADRAVTRKPVLTLYRQRTPEVGLPTENPKLNEPGLVIGDFVDRAGDPAGIAAADNTTHRSETLVADALRALAYTATDGRALPDAVAVTHPAHWDAVAVNSVRVALSRVSEWSRGRLALLPDSTAALFALRLNPGLPNSGTIAVCDFGGSGATVSLVDAANGYQAIAPAVRTEDFSGDRIDQALLTHVVGDLSSAGAFDSSATSAIGSLNKLRTACRYAKERLSSTMETEMTPELPGHHGGIRLSRVDLEDAIRQPLHGFVDFLHEVLERNGIRPTDLAAIATVGGGASIPLVTRMLSEQSGALVVTAPRPHLTAAVGAALRAARGPGDSETALAPTAAGSALDAMTVADIQRESASAPALAWSEAGDDSGIMQIRPGEYGDEPGTGSLAPVRPRPRQDLAAEPVIIGDNSDPWYRRPVLVAISTALAVLAIGAGVLLTIRHTSGSTPAPSVSTTPVPAPSAPTSSVSSDSQAPTSSPSSSTPPDTSTAPSTTSETPTTTTTTEAPSTTTTTSQPPTTTTQGPDRPDRPRLPRDRDGRLFPEPGGR
jgi:actin-like ATPase involved in cell morphogenesis